jgi:cyclic-di-GMP-binding protein
MPSFDVVNKVDMQEVDNAVNYTRKIITTRYDFRGSETEINLNKKDQIINIVTEGELKLKAIKDCLDTNLIKRKVDCKSLSYGEPEPTSKGHIKVIAKIQMGIDKDTCRKIVKMIKDLKLKVQAAIQDEQVRVTAKKIDDLQAIIQMLKEKDLEMPLQYVNMKR